MTLSAEELYRRGVEHGNAGRNAAARRALVAARDRTDDPDLRARIAGTLAYLAARTGDPAGAETLCREALGLAGVSPATAAIVWGQLGVLAVGRGDWDEAVRWLDQAIDALGEAEPARRNRMYLNRSVAHMQAGRLGPARDDLERAAAGYAAVGGENDLAMVRHNLGYVALLEGDLVTAMNLMTAAREVLQEVSPVNAAIGELDLAEVLRDAGLTTEAERTLARVARVFGAHGMRQARAEAEYNLARSLLFHDPAAAARVARAAGRRFRALGSRSWLARAEGVRVRADLARGARPSDTAVAAAAADLERLGFAGDAAAVRLSHRLWDGSPVGPVRVPGGAPLQVRLLADEVRAARAAAAGDHSRARRHAARGLDALAGWQASFGSLDLQTSITMHGTGLASRGVAAALRTGSPAAIFEWSERARLLSQQVVPLRPPPDPQLAADLAELRSLRADNPGGDWLGGPRAARLRERARHRQWTATGVAGVTERIGLAELRAGLGAESAFATYLFDGERLGCLVVTAEAARVVAPPDWTAVSGALAGLRADLEVAAALGAGPMAARVDRALQERLAALDRLLVADLLRAAGDRRIVLTAPGVLAGVPWPMLPGLRGRPFTLATSATRWLADRGRTPRGGVGLVAGPGVARAEEEVGLAAGAWPTATVLRGPQARVETVTGLAGSVGILHIAAHGRHAVDNPLFSGLDLADGTLFGYDIDQMPRVPQVVVLSACEVGRSAVRWGEEAIGMTRAWLHAGTTCVVAAPVVVADDLACELLGAMHAGLAAGRTPSEALAQVGVTAPFLCHGSGF